MAVVNASLRGRERGVAVAMLMDLARKAVFLHDNSVASLDKLLDPQRRAAQSHARATAERSARRRREIGQRGATH